MSGRGKLRFAAVVLGAGVLGAVLVPAGAAGEASTLPEGQRSPALCGPEDDPEPGIQGDVPRGQQPAYNCGLTLLGELPIAGEVQGAGHCAYVRTGDSIRVIDVSDPSTPTQVGEVPTFGGGSDDRQSETMRAVTTDERAVLVSGAGVYDISDCENPVVKGQIEWPQSGSLCCPHDIRVSHDATKVYMSFGTVVADISNLDDPDTWTVRDHTCDVAAQYHPLHAAEAATLGSNRLCEEVNFLQGQQSHGPDDNQSGTRLYVGGQTVVANGLNPGEVNRLRILDLTVDPPQLLDELRGPGHSIDWFRTADGREYILHANEFAAQGTSCVPHPRPSSLGWANEAFLTEVTGDTLRRASRVELAINQPENCAAKLESGQNASVSYHSVDNPEEATFAMVSFGDSLMSSPGAGLRVFDIRNPRAPVEVAYFNHGPLDHSGVSHYDASRGLLYVPGEDAFWVLELQSQVREHLGLDESDEWQPGEGRPPWTGQP